MTAFMTKQRISESKTCRMWLQWMALQHPAVYNHVIKIDNEGLSNRANAVSLGLHVGASDYFIAWPTMKYYGCWIEAKPEHWRSVGSNATHTDRQMRFGEKMKARGYAFYFCVGLDEMMRATNDYLNAS